MLFKLLRDYYQLSSYKNKTILQNNNNKYKKNLKNKNTGHVKQYKTKVWQAGKSNHNEF